jgi:hypothetical protein
VIIAAVAANPMTVLRKVADSIVIGEAPALRGKLSSRRRVAACGALYPRRKVAPDTTNLSNGLDFWAMIYPVREIRTTDNKPPSHWAFYFPE